MKNPNKLYWIKQEILQIQKEIGELAELEKSTNEFLPEADALERIKTLSNTLNEKMVQYALKRDEIESFIWSIEDEEIRTYARLRYIENFSYEAIGFVTYRDKSTVKKKLDKYIEEHCNE